MTSEPAFVSQQITWLARWTSLLAFGLLASTWPLWLGPTEFPQIPLSARLVAAPPWVDWFGIVVLLVGLTGVLWGHPRATSVAWLCVLSGGLVLVALDQHRLQPWLYQLLFFALIIVLSEPLRTRKLLIGIVVSVYFYSALGKFDAEFLHTVGQLFFRGMLEILGRTQAGDAAVPIAWVALLPVTELLLAVGLAWHRTRPAAGACAIVFHLGLLTLLSPLGLNHSWGVVLWNLQFAGQAWVLFVWPARHRRPVATQVARTQVADTLVAGTLVAGTLVAGTRVAGTAPAVVAPALASTTSGWLRFRQRWQNRLATAIAAGVMILPAAERLGLWDHWTSWALYAPHSSRVELWIAGTALDRLPRSLQSILPSGSADTLWVRIPLERWSLAETKSPIYPQARFQLGVAAELARRVDSEFLVRAVVRGVASRWDGRRTSREYVGCKAIEQAGNQLFWLNTRSRFAP